MAKTQKDFSAIQGDLFRELEQPALEQANAPDLDLLMELRGAMSQALREARTHYGYSRERIVDRMNSCLPEEHQVTKRQLDSWMALSKEDRHFPAELLPPFCWATHSLLPFQVLLGPLDHEAQDIRDRMVQRVGELEIHRSQIVRETRALKNRLGG